MSIIQCRDIIVGYGHIIPAMLILGETFLFFVPFYFNRSLIHSLLLFMNDCYCCFGIFMHHVHIPAVVFYHVVVYLLALAYNPASRFDVSNFFLCRALNVSRSLFLCHPLFF